MTPHGKPDNQENALPDLGGLSVLVAEDHDFQRQMLVQALRSLRVGRISEAQDGMEALDHLKRPDTRTDITICDLDMPNMDGMELIRRISETGTRSSLILTSALDRTLIATVGTMARDYGIRLLGAIEKPVTPQKLQTLIARHLSIPQVLEKPRGPGLSGDEILSALEEERFEAFFQPKIDLHTGLLVGAEALARMRHPKRGIVGPSEFIGFLEEHGLIDRLTWTILRQASSACADWLKNGLEITVSVNLSLKSLHDPALADQVTQMVRASGLDPVHVVLEITESAAMADVGPALENQARLRMKGFGLSIDDFGTGYASLQQLARAPFTELKIDRSFVANASQNPRRNVMLESSNELARRLGLKSVAEGVETRSDWDHLRKIDCSVAQGYFIAKPMPAADFLGWARAWRPPSQTP
jgi:EAL domain-containing protein (putative c-di-GMP-specific phosphodiesterase class I)/CheY-like chemotaxis protein